MPAACVMVANCTRRFVIDASASQVSTNPDDGGSNATGGPAIDVQVSHSASGSVRCAYWIGRPWRASPSQTMSGEPSNASATRRG